MKTLTRLANGSYFSPDDPGEMHYNAPRISITDEEGEYLTQFATARYVLEIGTGLGVSTRYLAKRAKRVYSLDPDPWVQEHVWPEFAGVSNVTFDLPEKKVDLVFIDGCHLKGQLADDVELAKFYLNPGGRIIFHDAKQLDLRPFGTPTEILETTHGLAVISVE